MYIYLRTVAKSPYFRVSKQKINVVFGYVNKLFYFTAANTSTFQLQGRG